jgi:hypothetical protein
MKLLNLMIPDIAMFWVISTALVLQELSSRRGDQKKNPLTRIFSFYESRQKPVQFEIFSRNFASRLYCKIALLWFSKKWIIVM